MSDPHLGERLATLLEDQIRFTTELAAVLGHEEAALRARDLAAVDALGKRKRTLIERLGETDAARKRLVGPSSDPRGGDPMGMPDLPPLRVARDRLVALLVEVKKQNRINGAIIDATYRHAQRMIDALVGRRPGERLYDSLGATRRMITNRFSSSA